jgi:hypothetical protein
MASFFADVGHEIPTALLPSLLTATLGDPRRGVAAPGAAKDTVKAVRMAARWVRHLRVSGAQSSR